METSNTITPVEQTMETPQYSLLEILWIWLLAALPMGLLSWVVFPAVSPDYRIDPLGAAVTRVVLLGIGLIWLFILSMILVRREEGHLTWAAIKLRLRLNRPHDPRTGHPRARLWLWLVPLLLVLGAWQMGPASTLAKLWTSVFPFFAEPEGYSFGVVLESQAIRAELVGAWWFLGLFILLGVFNTFLGEEFLFRGILLPRMEGVFGNWAWIANAVLFGLWHVHQPWTMAGGIVGGLFFAWASWRFRSTWMGIILHSAQTVFFSVLILGLVLGLA
jgi:uncharacterized protein